VELLAPAGSWEALLAAIGNGADAVYLGGKDFSARQYADNFDLPQLERAVFLAHQKGVKIYVTLNTLLKEGELSRAFDYAQNLYRLGVDALIVTDLGLISALRESLPDFPLHASTQLTVHEEEALKLLQTLGIRRVVLARELSLSEISRLAETGVEVEVFVHGALCISYSGQCLFSSLIGGRSGNRGRCAQPCRLPYALLDPKGRKSREGYLLSPKDLCYLPALSELKAAGVTSLKIEGRMKRPEYVATVVRVYREALDNLAEGKPLPGDEELLQIFNRGFTTGYLFQNPGPKLMSYQRPNNRGVPVGRVKEYRKKQALISLERPLRVGDGIEVWVSKGRVGTTVEKMTDQGGRPLEEAEAGDKVWLELPGKTSPGDRVFRTHDKLLMEKARASIKPPEPLPITFILRGKVGQPAALTAIAQGHEVEVHGEALAEEAQKRPLDEEIASRHLFKLGDTPFAGGEIVLDLEGEIALPPSELNRLRREAVAELTAKISGQRQLPPDLKPLLFQKKERQPAKPRLAVKAGEGLWQAALEAGADLIYLPADLPDLSEAVRKIAASRGKAYLTLPRINTREETQKYRKLAEKHAENLAGILIGHLGQLKEIQKLGLPAISDFGFNVMNAKAASAIFAQGIERATVSVELRTGELKELLEHHRGPFEAIVGGNLPLLITKHCPLRSSGEECSSKGCRRGIWHLEDRMGEKFPLLQDGACRTVLYNSHMLSVLEELPAILKLGLDVLRIEALFGERKAWEKFIRLHRQHLDAAWGAPQYQVPAELRQELEDLFGTPITRGHFFRGVE
jgi:putative protease